MEISYSKDTYHYYMVIGDTGLTDDNFEARMLSDLNSEYLLPFHLQSLNGQIFCYYDITGKISLDVCMQKRAVDAETVRSIIASFAGCGRVLDEYLLNPDSLMVQSSCIYMDTDLKKMYIAYIPGYEMDFVHDLGKLTEELLQLTDHEDKEAVLLVYDFFRLVRQPKFSIQKLEDELLHEKTARKKETYASLSENIVSPTQETQEPELIHYDFDEEQEASHQAEGSNGFHGSGRKNRKRKSLESRKIVLPLVIAAVGCLVIYLMYYESLIWKVIRYFGLVLDDWIIMFVCMGIWLAVTVVIAVLLNMHLRTDKGSEDIERKAIKTETDMDNTYLFTDEAEENTTDGKTIVLSGNQGEVRLISLNKQICDDLVIRSFPCVIGSRREDAQVVISVPGISRRHALIEQKEIGFFITDLDSTNGTYAGSSRLTGDEKHLLVREEIIAFGDVRFMFLG